MDKQVSVFIKSEVTEEVREFKDKWNSEDIESCIYLWEEGNFACDCNRALMFARCGNEEDPEDRPCGDVLYTVTKIVLDGEMVYDEEVNG